VEFAFLIPDSRFRRGRRALSFALAAGLTLGVSGCGRRGALEPPPDPSAVQKPANSSNGEPAARKKVLPITPPKTPFILDPLL
jgi:predicted small lipoprotein YifL